jgi:hypothetical protein
LLKKVGESRSGQGAVYFYIGLAQLGEGKREEAKESFRRTMNWGSFSDVEYWWSRAFLARIDDPQWLPWIPVEK